MSVTGSHSVAISRDGGEDISKRGVGDAGTGSAIFDPSMSGRTIGALLQVMAMLTKISNIWSKLFADQVKVQAEIANNLARSHTKLGEQESSQMLSQGFSMIGGGAASAAVGMASSMQGKSTIGEADTQLQGAKQYRDCIKNEQPQLQIGDANLVQERGGSFEKGLAALKEKGQFSRERPTSRWRRAFKGRSYEMVDPTTARTAHFAEGEQPMSDKDVMRLLTPEERSELVGHYDKKIEGHQKQLDNAIQQKSTQGQQLAATSQTLNTMTNAGGNIAASIYAKGKGMSNAHISSSGDALQGLHSASGQARNGFDGAAKEVTDISQMVTAISQADRVNG